MCEMQLQASDHDDGMSFAEGSFGATLQPFPYAPPSHEAHLAHLSWIIRSLGNLPRAIRNRLDDSGGACNGSPIPLPKLPKLPQSVLRPLVVYLMLPDALLNDGPAASVQPTVQQQVSLGSPLSSAGKASTSSSSGRKGAFEARTEEGERGEGCESRLAVHGTGGSGPLRWHQQDDGRECKPVFNKDKAPSHMVESLPHQVRED